MSWKETCAMSERMRFIGEMLQPQCNVTELCRRYGISRKTGYKWAERYRDGGVAALAERSHAPLQQAQAVDVSLVQLLVQSRHQHPSWGPRKLLAWLLKRHPRADWPAASTVGQILRRHGLVQPRKRHVSATGARYGSALVEAYGPNVVWCTDFKGQFRTQDQIYCYPLTLTDAFSRYLLVCRGMLSPTTQGVRPWFERAFREHGLPCVIRSDNGSPFATQGLVGLSRLAIWWIKLGIIPERIVPGCPQQNGRHERMHKTLKQETTTPAAANLRAQQRVFDRFVAEFNQERPHEALGQRPPARVYAASQRQYPPRIPRIEYPQDYLVRTVYPTGEIKIGGHRVFVSETLAGEPLGLVQIDETLWRLHFASMPLALLDARVMRIRPLENPADHENNKDRGASPPDPLKTPYNREKVLPISPV